MHKLPPEVDGHTQQPNKASTEGEIMELLSSTITELHGNHIEISYKAGRMKIVQCTVHAIDHDPVMLVKLDDHCGIQGVKYDLATRKSASSSSLLGFSSYFGSRHRGRVKSAVKWPSNAIREASYPPLASACEPWNHARTRWDASQPYSQR